MKKNILTLAVVSLLATSVLAAKIDQFNVSNCTMLVPRDTPENILNNLMDVGFNPVIALHGDSDFTGSTYLELKLNPEPQQYTPKRPQFLLSIGIFAQKNIKLYDSIEISELPVCEKDN